MRRTSTPESELLRLTLDWLAANHILVFRQNTGAIATEGRFFRFGVPGMSDVVAFPKGRVVWLELKAKGRYQSPLQKSFQSQVVEAGHRYAVCRTLEDVMEAVR